MAFFVFWQKVVDMQLEAWNLKVGNFLSEFRKTRENGACTNFQPRTEIAYIVKWFLVGENSHMFSRIPTPLPPSVQLSRRLAENSIKRQINILLFLSDFDFDSTLKPFAAKIKHRSNIGIEFDSPNAKPLQILETQKKNRFRFIISILQSHVK